MIDCLPVFIYQTCRRGVFYIEIADDVVPEPNNSNKNKFMPKGEYTSTEAGRQAFLAVTGIKLPDTLTHEEIKAQSCMLYEDQKKRCYELYLQYMSIGRPEYLTKYRKKHGC